MRYAFCSCCSCKAVARGPHCLTNPFFAFTHHLQVFLAQKMLLRAANAVGVPVFVTRVVDTLTGCSFKMVDFPQIRNIIMSASVSLGLLS